MKLNNAEFKVFRELEKLEKEGKLTPDKAELLKKLREKKASNALEWWAKYPELLKDAVNVAFNYLAGKGMIGVGDPQHTYYQPGIVRIPYIQTIGVATDKTSAFNVQMYQLWLYMHRKYRGIGAYQMSDLAIAIFCIIDAFANVAEAERIYAIANTYLAGNRNVPYSLAVASNIDLDEISANLADFRYGINLINRKLKALSLPKGLSMLDNRITLNTGVFKDADNNRSAIFFWDTDFYCVYEAATYTTGGSATYKRHYISGSKRTSADILYELNEQVDALLLDDDIARICSDIIAAFDGDVEQATEMPEEYCLNIVKSDERLIQFHNMSYFAKGVATTPCVSRFSAAMWAEVSGLTSPGEHYMDIVQENNVVLQNLIPMAYSTGIITDSDGCPFPYTNNDNGKLFVGPQLFDCWEDHPTAETVMCGTRFKYVARKRTVVSGGNSYIGFALDTYGSELCLAPEYYTMKANGVVSQENTPNRQWANAASANLLNAPQVETKFDWHPLIYMFGGASAPDDANPTFSGIFGDLDNFVVMPLNTLERLHEVALLSGYKLESVTSMK